MSEVQSSSQSEVDQAPPHPELTIIILTYDEANHIEDCVKSVSWADRVVVFDRYSDDDTVELARNSGAEIGQETFHNFAQQRNAALDFVRTDWVFFVDADERGTKELAAEIRDVILSRPEVAWHVPRDNFIFGRLTRGAGWYPDYQLRLFKHGCVHYERPVHEIAVVDGQEGYLVNSLIHHNYRDTAHFHAKQAAYNDFDATILKQQGLRPKTFTPLSQSIRHFWWRYVSLNGYQDGLHGLRLSAYMAYYEWAKYRKLATLWYETDS